MNAHDFRRIALSLEGAEEGSHMGAADFRVGGRIFATLAAVKLGYGNLMLTPEQQATFIEEQPEVFFPSRAAGAGMARPICDSRLRMKTCCWARCAPHGNCVWRKTRRHRSGPEVPGDRREL